MEGLREEYDEDIAFASALEMFGGGRNDMIGIAFGGPVMTKYTNFAGTTLLLALVGGFISDSYLNRFQTNFFVACIELVGYTVLLIQAHYESLKSFPCNPFDKSFLCEKVSGVFRGTIQNMHMYWKFHETVQVCCDNFPKEKIREMATMLSGLSGGTMINIRNVKTIIMYRGKNYRQPRRLTPINTLTNRKALFKAIFE